MAQHPQFNFTIYNSYPSSKANCSDGKPILFSSHRVQGAQPTDLSTTFSTHASEFEALGESLVSIIQIENYTPAVVTSLEKSFSHFPQYLLENLVLNTSDGRNISVIPSSHDESIGVRTLMNFPIISPCTRPTGVEICNMISFLPVAVWICPSSFIKNTKFLSSKMMVLLICTSPHVPQLLISYYGASYQKRWTRLQKNPAWIFPDILHVLGAWSEIWNITKGNLGVYHRHIHNYCRPMRLLDTRKSRSPRLLELARLLHDENATLLTVGEQLRVHSGAISRFLRLDIFTVSQDVIERLQEHLDDVQYHEQTSQVLIRQLENIMSLVFEIETINQGQAVARLNFLAFAFLPLSWVASLFGMTKFSISATWYPLWAVVALAVVATISFTLPLHGSSWSRIGPSIARRLNKDILEPTSGSEVVPDRTKSSFSHSTIQTYVSYDNRGRRNQFSVPSQREGGSAFTKQAMNEMPAVAEKVVG